MKVFGASRVSLYILKAKTLFKCMKYHRFMVHHKFASSFFYGFDNVILDILVNDTKGNRVIINHDSYL